MNEVIIQIFIYLLLSSLLGTILYLVWKLLGQWVEKKGYVDTNYWIWKIVLLSFLCPVPFLMILRMQKNGTYGFDFWQTDIIVKIMKVLLILWVAGLLVNVVRYIRKHWKIHRIIKETGYQTTNLEIKIKDICKELKIHRNIQVIILDFMQIN